MSNCAGLAQGGQEAILPCHLGVHGGLDALQEPDGSDGGNPGRSQGDGDLRS